MEIAKFRASLSLPFRFRCNPLRPRCCVCNVYTFLKNFVYHPTYQAERKQKRTFYFSPAALHLLQNSLDLASMPYNGGSCDIVWRRTDRLLRFLRVWLFSGKLSDEASNWISLLHSWTPSLLRHSSLLEGTLQ